MKFQCVDGEHTINDNIIVMFETIREFVDLFGPCEMQLISANIHIGDIIDSMHDLHMYLKNMPFVPSERCKLILEYLGCNIDITADHDTICDSLVKGKKMECLEYVMKNYDYKPNEKTMNIAIINGDVSCMQFLHANGCKLCKYTSCLTAIVHGSVECLDFACNNGAFLDKNIVFSCAVRHDKSECLSYLMRRFPRESMMGMCILAAINGSIRCLKYLHENGHVCDENTMATAASSGKLECLKYLCDNKCPMNGFAIMAAITNGHLDCLKYLYSVHPIVFDKTCATIAAHKGFYDCLIFIVENGCIPQDDICNILAINGHLESLKYMHSKGFEINEITYERALMGAVTHGNYSCIPYLAEQLNK